MTDIHQYSEDDTARILKRLNFKEVLRLCASEGGTYEADLKILEKYYWTKDEFLNELVSTPPSQLREWVL